MKTWFALALLGGLTFTAVGCSEKSKVEEKVVTPGGSTTTETTVEKTGDHKAP